MEAAYKMEWLHSCELPTPFCHYISTPFFLPIGGEFRCPAEQQQTEHFLCLHHGPFTSFESTFSVLVAAGGHVFERAHGHCSVSKGVRRDSLDIRLQGRRHIS